MGGIRRLAGWGRGRGRDLTGLADMSAPMRILAHGTRTDQARIRLPLDGLIAGILSRST